MPEPKPYARRDERPLSRRDFLRTAALGAAGVALDSGRWAFAKPHRHHRSSLRRWSDRRTWKGKVPGRGSVAVVHGRVLLDRNASVAGVRIMPGSELVFERARNRTLSSTGNIEVMGKLTMRPRRGRRHRILFSNVNEATFVGGGMEVLPSDIGLWVMDQGTLNIEGTRKLPWTRTAGSVTAGATRITLKDEPVGWQVGDTIVLTPTISPTQQHHLWAYDQATVKAIRGRTIELSSPTAFPHPEVEVKPGSMYGPEVLNLSRTVEIQGSPEGRSHILIHSTVPQTLRYAGIRYMGPQQSSQSEPHFVAGRYGLHFHHCGDGSRGSLVEGVVVSQSGAHAFVPHMSHGVTFRECISHETTGYAYWYDPPTDNADSFTHDAVYERCVASAVLSEGAPLKGYRNSGFFLGAGNGNQVRGCVAVGVTGWSSASGFHWPEQFTGVWLFEDSVAHNNVRVGLFSWQNNHLPHEINRFVAYHNGHAGISHGAYTNQFRYKDVVLYGNLAKSIHLSAVSRANRAIVFENVICDGAGLHDYAVTDYEHGFPASFTTQFVNCSFSGYKQAAVLMRSDPNEAWTDFIDCTFAGNEFWLDSDIQPATRIRVRDAYRGELSARRWDQLGQPRPEWNAVVTPGW